MNVVNIYFLQEINEADAQFASIILNAEKKYHVIDNVNWPLDFSYCPDSKFIIARSNSALYLQFQIKETNIRALYPNDQDPVYEDSCVEFFCKMQESETYMNFEFNCIGTCIATTRKGKNVDVIPFTEEQMTKIDRFSSLGNQPFYEKDGVFNWDLTVKIPFEVLGLNLSQNTESLLGNFYKCAEGTTTPHFVSWNPILTETPDFHRPEFFGELCIN